MGAGRRESRDILQPPARLHRHCIHTTGALLRCEEVKEEMTPQKEKTPINEYMKASLSVSPETKKSKAMGLLSSSTKIHSTVKPAARKKIQIIP